MTFSERQGFKSVKQVLQTNSIDSDLRNRLWNVLRESLPRFEEGYGFTHYGNTNLKIFCNEVWHDYFKLPIDSIPRLSDGAIATIRQYFFDCEWFEVYDLVEFAVPALASSRSPEWIEAQFNEVLAGELSAYRFIEHKIVPISSELEVTTIEEAIAQTVDEYSSTSEHLKQAVTLLAQKPNPDYRNSIKESISAVEALCAVITGDAKATLGQALKLIDKQAPLHGALQSAFERLYGYTSDADGIRHALMDETKLEQEDAVFMLVTCSAFVSYVIAKRARKSS